MQEKIVILGASAAGLSAAERLRAFNKEAEIWILTQEAEDPYNKCKLVDCLSNELNQNDVFLKKSDFFILNKINLVKNEKAVSIDQKNQLVHFESGLNIYYDKLLVAVGVQPIIPKELSSNKKVFAFNTLADLFKIQNQIKNKNYKKILVLGSGLTGVEVADALVKLKSDVSLVTMADRLLHTLTDTEISALIKKSAEESEIQIYLNDSINKIENYKEGIKAHLKSGSSINCDLIIVAVGAKIDTNLFKNMDIEISDTGIIVNDYMQTKDPKTYAAGDVCSIFDKASKKHVKSSTWPDAVLQGMIAGINMAGQQKKHPGTLAIGASHFFGKDFMACGNWSPCQDQSILSLNQGETLYKFLIDKDGLLVGFSIFGEIKGISFLKNSILTNEIFDIEQFKNKII